MEGCNSNLSAHVDEFTLHTHMSHRAAYSPDRDPVVSLSTQPSHRDHVVQHDQVRDSGRAWPSGGVTTQAVGGMHGSDGGASCGTRPSPQSTSQAWNTSTQDDAATQRSLHQEGQADRPLQGTWSSCEQGRHHPRTSEEVHPGDLRSGREHSRGSSGIRNACSSHIPRDPGPREAVRRVDHPDLQRRTVRFQVGTSGHVAPQTEGTTPGGRGSFHEQERTRSTEHSLLCGGDGRHGLQDEARAIGAISQGRTFSEILDIGKLHQLTDGPDQRGDPDAGGVCPRSEGGDQRHEGWQGACSQEEPHGNPLDPPLHGEHLHPAKGLSSVREDVSSCPGPNPSCCLGETTSTLGTQSVQTLTSLKPGEARHLESQAQQLLPQLYQSLTSEPKVRLIEVACSPDSVLSQVMQDVTKSPQAAMRLSIWNQHDLCTGSGVKSILDKIDHHDPSHVWLAPECGPYSIMQNINQRNPEQKEALAAKGRLALKQYVGCAVIFRYCQQKGIHVTWELSQSCQAWRLPLIQRLIHQCEPFVSIIRGCQVNLRDPKGNFISKGWKIMTTHPLLAARMDLPCSCAPKTVHVPCEGQLTRGTAFYTKELAKRVCDTILQGTSKELIHKEMNGRSTQTPKFGQGTICICEEARCHEAEVVCGHCNSHVCQHRSIDVCAVDTKGPPISDLMTSEEIQRRLYLLHSATGHGPIRYLSKLLKQRNVSPKVLVEVEKFKCPVCQERVKPTPRNLASLEPLPPKFATVSADVGHWYHPVTKEKWQFLIMIDEGSRFRVARMVSKGKQQHLSTAQFLMVFGESWVEYFGHPLTLRMDPDGAFRSHELIDYCDRYHIFLDLIPGEAHWKLAACEKSIQSIKSMLEAIVEDQPEISAQEALSEAVKTLNHRDMVRGYSPVQHILGKAPDEVGRFLTTANQRCSELISETPAQGQERSQHLRDVAEKALLEWNAQQRLQRATHSKHRRCLDYQAGELVYIWRQQLTGQDAQQNKAGKGRFVGPARILATESVKDDHGELRRGSSVWLFRGRRLLKCCPEQLRRASDREVIIAEIHDPDPAATWDFPKVAQQLGGNDFDDMTEVPSEEEWHRASEPQHEWQPTVRYRHKSGPPATPRSRSPMRDVLPAEPEASTSSGSRGNRSRSPHRSQPAVGFVSSGHWTDLVHQSYFSDTPEVESTVSFTNGGAIQIELEMPQQRNATEKVLKDLPAYFATAFKKRAVEVSERRLTDEEKLLFGQAKAIEVSNFLSARAFEAIPSPIKVSREDAVRMRWILTWKQKEDGGRKAKARAVLLGYQDPKYEQRATMSPTTTRQTRQIQLQIAASYGFITQKGDVTGAFLQSREYPDDLLCIPCPEICQAMGLAPESVTRVRRACYGLVDAPLEWYRSICQFFETLGLQRCWSDPCCWKLMVQGKLHGIISGHVDDFLFSGSVTDPVWNKTISAIQKEYRWGDWEKDKFIQCGVLIECNNDGTYALSQEKYVEELKYIPIRAHRKRDRNAETDDFEKSQL